MEIRIGTRRSDLARWQANHVAMLIAQHVPDLSPILHRIGSVGDRDRRSTFQSIGGIGVFTKESEEALLNGECDLVVHSLKDLPTTSPEGLTLAAVPVREDPRDCLCGVKLEGLLPGVRIGTGSIRRRAQLLKLCPELVMKPIRGNVPPRLRKAKCKEGIDATVLAAAGLKRLGIYEEADETLSTDVFPYAIGQGALGIQAREDSPDLVRLLKLIECTKSRVEIDAERAMLHHLGAGCSLPVGAAVTWIDQEHFSLTGTVTAAAGTTQIKASEIGNLESAKELGVQVAEKLIQQGSKSLLLDAELAVREARKE